MESLEDFEKIIKEKKEEKKYRFEELSDSEKMFLLSSIDTKFSLMSNLISSIKSDLDLIYFRYSGTYNNYLETLNNNIYVFSDIFFRELDPEDKFEESRVY